MPKRFTDTDKWKKPFIRSLEAPYKLLWFYILDDCNHAGIWEVDMEVASLRIGEKLSELYALEKFGDRVQKISDSKWFLPDFISFQYGELNEKNRLHLSVINILKKYQIKPLRSPLEGAKEQYKDKEKDKDMVKDKEKVEGGLGETGKFLVPQMFEKYKKNIPTYPGSIDRDFKPLLSIAKFLLQQGGLKGSLEDNTDQLLIIWEKGCQIISEDNFYRSKSLSTISNHIQEIVQIGINGKSTNNTKGGKPVSASSAFSKIDRMSG